MDDLFSKFVVVAFRDDKQAYAGVRALKDLHGEGAISLYGYAVVQRSADGFVSVKDSASEGPIGTGVGALVGALMGLFAGPGGAVVGMTIGTAVGASRDLFSLGVSGDFIDSVGAQLAPGSTALVAEISEDWLAPLNSRMETIGGTVVREWRDDYVDDELQRSMDKDRMELTQRRAEFAAAAADKKDALKKQVAKAEQKLRSALDRADTRLDRYGHEAEAKIHALQEQAKTTAAGTKERIEQRVTALRADHERRKAKLGQARKLAQEALKP